MLTIAGTGGRKRYYCANKKEKGTSVCKGIVSILQSDAEELVFEATQKKLMTEEAYDKFRVPFEKHFKSGQSGAQNDYEMRTRAIRE